MMSIIQVLFQTQAEITLVEREGALGPDNRNHLAQMALDGGHTHGTVTGTTFLDHPPVIYPRQMGVQLSWNSGGSSLVVKLRGLASAIARGIGRM